MFHHLFQRKTLIWPTRLGWICLLLPPVLLCLLWVFFGEVFLSPSRPVSADILVVEGWAGRDSLTDALAEFRRGHYRLIVTAGGPTGGDWRTRPWNYADLAAKELARLGALTNAVLAAPARQTNGRRTYEAAVAVRKALEARGGLPNSFNLWTCGNHARRSRLVFSKVFGSQTRVGVIAWQPPDTSGPWWKSSDRARDFFEESLAYLYERLLNSGRPPAP